MPEKSIEFEAKIKVKDKVSAKTFLGLLKYISEDLGFSIKGLESDEIKLIRKATQRKGAEKDPTAENTGAEIEIEISDDELEIEIESENIETVQDLVAKIALLL